MPDYRRILERPTQDPRYLANLDWGEPRAPHPEGTIRAHIAVLESNLALLTRRLTPTEQAHLRLLIHAHDTMKPDASEGTPVGHPRNHDTLGAQFLSQFIDDPALIEMARLHDEPHGIWRRHRSGRGVDSARLYAAFLLIDGRTEGKSRTPLRWFFNILRSRQLLTRFGSEDIP